MANVARDRKLSGLGWAARLCLPLTSVLALVLLAAMVGACHSSPAEDRLPGHLRLVPCGGKARLRPSGSPEWVSVETQVTVDGEARIEAEGDGGARLCLEDGSILELAPGTAVDLRPAEEGLRLEIALQEGSVRLLAQEASYQFAISACPVEVTEIPARVRVERLEGVAHVWVEKGSAVCAKGDEPLLLGTGSELVAAPGQEPQIAQTSEVGRQVPTSVAPTATSTGAPVPTVTATVGVTASPTRTPTPTTVPSASPSVTPQPSPEPATATPEPTPIP